METVKKVKKDVIRKCSNCKKNLPTSNYEFRMCPECREEARTKERAERLEKESKEDVDLFDFSTFRVSERHFLATRLRRYLGSEEYDLKDPVVEYQIYSILLEELEVRKLRLSLLKMTKKQTPIVGENLKKQIDSAHKRLRDLWGDLNTLIRQKIPDGVKRSSVSEMIKDLEESRKEVKKHELEKNKMKEALKKRIEAEDL